MGAPTPDLEVVITAIVAEMDAIAPDVGEVRAFEHTFDSEVEFIELFQTANFDVDIWLVDVVDIPEEEGDAASEQYSLYGLRIRYISMRKDDPGWSAATRILFEIVRTKLNKNPAVFAIGGQRQLRTSETVSISSYAPRNPVEDQIVYETQITLTVEARRFT